MQIIMICPILEVLKVNEWFEHSSKQDSEEIYTGIYMVNIHFTGMNFCVKRLVPATL